MPDSPDAERRSLNADMKRLRHLFGGRVARGATGSFFLQVANAGLAFTTAILLARTLGAAEFGIYSFVIAVAGILAVPANLGFRIYLVREVARLLQQADWAALRGLVSVAFSAVLFVSLAVVSAVWLLANAQALPVSAAASKALSIGIMLVPVVALVTVFEGVMRGLHRVTRALTPDSFVRPMAFFLLVSAWVLFQPGPKSAIGAVQLNVLAAVAALISAVILVKKTWPKPASAIAPTTQLRTWVTSAVSFSAIASVTVIQSNADLVMLGSLASPEATGIYRAVSRVATLIVFALEAVNAAVAPRIAALYTAGQLDGLQSIAAKSALATTTLALPAAIALIFGGDIVLSVFGANFTEGATALSILALGYVASAMAGSAAHILSMTRYANFTLIGLSISTAINICLNILLIPSFGMEGAAIATCTSMIAWNLILVGFVWWKLGLNPTVINQQVWRALSQRLARK
jgi:O-antigen/teichoic acid export membrane protein